MILKISGMLLVMLATVTAGLYYGNLETYRINDLQEFKKALCILKAEIEFSFATLPEALRNIAERTKKPISNIFADFGSLLVANRKRNIEDLWERSIQMHSKEVYFNNEDFDALKAFGKTLGYLDKTMQSTSILVTISYIDGAVARLGETRGKNKKLFNSLGVLCGLITVIILI